MATLNANMSDSQGWVPLSESDANSIEPGHYILDDEYIVVAGPHIGSPGRTSTRANGRWVARAVAGSTAATHLSGATLTRYYPDAPGGEGGGTPTLAEVLAEGNDPAGNTIEAEAGGVEEAGGDVDLAGGTGNDGETAGAELRLGGGSDGSDHGRVRIKTDGSYGSDGQVLTAAGDNTARWEDAGAIDLSDYTGASNILLRGAQGGAASSGESAQIEGGGGDGGNTSGAYVQAGGGAETDPGNIEMFAGQFIFIGLPTADPSIEGALWIDTGAGRVLKVSAGA